MLKSLMGIGLSFILFSYVNVSYAATAITPCSATATNYIVPFSDLNINPTWSVGQVIMVAKVDKTITCKAVGNTYGYMIVPSSTNVDYGLSTLTNVMNTSYPGLGIAWRNYSGNTGSWQIFTSFNNSSVRRGLAINSTTAINEEFGFVKTGDIAPGIYPGQRIDIRFNLDSSVSSNNGYTGDYVIYTLTIPSFSINVQGCTANSDEINVNMGMFNRSSFSGVGSTAGNEGFSIDLQCNPQTSVWYKLTANNGVNSSNTSVANLTSGSTATGVGIQILNSAGTPIVYDDLNFWKTTASTQESVSIPLTARYYQTMSQITAGSANGSVTFLITYQ